VPGRDRSKNLQARLNFKALARAQDVYNGHSAVASMWCGEYNITKEESLYKDLEDV